MGALSDKDMISAMTRAGVPRSCWSVSVKDTGRADYLEFAKEVSARSERREQPSTAYVRMRTAEGYLEVELLSKALVMAGIPTKYTTFHKLTRDLRMQERQTDEVDKLDAVYGRGAIVIPDVPLIASVAESSMTGYREAIDFLIGHAYDGGVLIIGGDRRLTKRLDAGYPPLLERLLIESSKQFEVK